MKYFVPFELDFLTLEDVKRTFPNRKVHFDYGIAVVEFMTKNSIGIWGYVEAEDIDAFFKRYLQEQAENLDDNF